MKNQFQFAEVTSLNNIFYEMIFKTKRLSIRQKVFDMICEIAREKIILQEGEAT